MIYAFYVSGHSGRLMKFLNKNDDNIISKISIVISDKEMPLELMNLLKVKNVSVKVIDYSNLEGKNNKEKNLELSNHIYDLLKLHGVDYMFSFGSHLLSGKLLKEYEYHLINFHPAILPMYPGNKSIDQAVNHGNTLLVGNTAHFIDEGMDTGKIIMQSVTPLQAFLDTGDYDIVLDYAVEMLGRLIYLLDHDRVKIENDKVRILGADYTASNIYPKLELNDI